MKGSSAELNAMASRNRARALEGQILAVEGDAAAVAAVVKEMRFGAAEVEIACDLYRVDPGLVDPTPEWIRAAADELEDQVRG